MNERQRAMLNRAADQLDRLATAVFQRYREVAMAEAESADELCKEIRSHLMSLAAPPARPHVWGEPKSSRSMTERKIRRCTRCHVAYLKRREKSECK